MYWPKQSIELLGILKKRRRRQWHPTGILLPGKSRGRRSLVGCSPWGRKESDTTERLHFHFSLPCIGEGNGNPLRCSCLENPRDGGAWWAAVYGIAQSRTRLKRHSSSSSSRKQRASHVAQLVEFTWNAGDPWVGKIPWRRDRQPTPVFLGFPVAQRVKYLPTMQETWVQSLGWKDTLEKGIATHSSIPAWRIPWTEERGGL